MIDYSKIKGKIWLDGKYIKSNQAKLHVLSHGLHFGSAVFEGIRVYNKKPFKIEEHLNRLYNSALLVGYKIPAKFSNLKKICFNIIKLQKLNNGYLRPVAWRGSQSMAPTSKSCKIHLSVAGWSWPTYYSLNAKSKGISLDVSKWIKYKKNNFPIKSKCASFYTTHTLAKIAAEKKKYDDSLMLDENQNVCETTSSNIFFIGKKTLYTPRPDNFIDGITRKIIFNLCKKNKIKVIEKNIKLKDIKKYQSCFITGTAAEVTPIKKIKFKKFDVKNTTLLTVMGLFQDLISSEI